MAGLFDWFRPNQGSSDVPDYSNWAGNPSFMGPQTPTNLAGSTGGMGVANPANGFGGMTGLGMNLGTAQLALGGLGAIGNLWNGFQAQGLAQKQFDFTKGVTNTNLANQLQSYNTALSDRARSRGVAEGQSQAQIDDYVNRNRLTR